MSDPRSIAQAIAEKAILLKVRFPKTFDDNQVRTACGTILMKHRLEDGSFNEEAVVSELTEKYGFDIPIEPSMSDVGTKKRRRKKGEEDQEDEGGDASKKKQGGVEYKVADNKPIAEAIREIGTIYFKNQDPRSGAVYAKASKAIRECETQIIDKKTALAVKGVGPSIASLIVELLTTGAIKKLANLRAGIA